MKTRWSNVTAEYSIEYTIENGVWENDGNEPPSFISLDEKETHCELMIEISSSGYYDSGCVSGPADNWYPPEGEDERTVIDAYIIYYNDGKKRIVQLDKSVFPKLEEHFYKKINELEIDTTDQDDYDYE